MEIAKAIKVLKDEGLKKIMGWRVHPLEGSSTDIRRSYSLSKCM